MATTSLKLSTKTDANGRSQVIVKLTISRTNRPCFKSGVFISPDWYKPIQEKSKGFVYGVVIPKKGRLNVLEVREAEQAKSDLDSFISRLTAVCNALNGKVEMTHEAIEDAMSLTQGMEASTITYQTIIDVEKQREKQEQESSTNKTFFEWMDYYLKSKELSDGRKRGFRVLVRMLARYQGFVRMTGKERKDFTLNIHTLDKDEIEGIFEFIANERALSEEYPEIFKVLLDQYPVEFSPKHKKNAIEERGRNAVIERKKGLKSFFNWLNANGYTTNRPFDNIEIGTPAYGTPFFLSLEERNIVADAKLSTKHLETQRDIFIFQCLVGCRVGDLLKLGKDNVKNGVLQYIPRKTKDHKPVVVSVPLNDRAKALVEKYEGVDAKGRLFPFISSQKYNDAIKEILTICDIKRKVTILNPTTGEEEQRPINQIASSHMARRTFIGNLYQKVKDPNLIGSLSGHVEGSQAFVRYRDIDLNIKKETVSLID